MAKEPTSQRVRFENLADGETFFRFLYGDEIWEKVALTGLERSRYNAISTFSGKTAELFEGALVVRTDR